MQKDMYVGERGSNMLHGRVCSVPHLQGDRVGQGVPRNPWVQYFQDHQLGQESPSLLQHPVGHGDQEDLVLL